MQKLISKYSLAAHLGILMAAPLFLYPYVGIASTCRVLAVLTALVAIWVIMEPSRRHGEMLHDARARLGRTIARSPLTAALLLTIAFSIAAACNSGLALVFDGQSAEWLVSRPRWPSMPASAAGAGMPPLVAAVMALVAGMAARLALGRRARLAFLVSFALVAGLSGVALALFFADGENARIVALVRNSTQYGSFGGCTFALAMMAGIAAIPETLARRWSVAPVLLVVAIAGSFVGMFFGCTMVEIAIFTAAALVLAVGALLYSALAVSGAGAVKALLLCAVALVTGGAFVVAVAPEWAGVERLQALGNFALLPPDYLQFRTAADAALAKAWAPVRWLGTGLGTIGWDLRFNACPEDWLVIPQAAATVPDGWRAALTERGYAGVAAIALPAAVLLLGWCWRLVAVLVTGVRRHSGEFLDQLLNPQTWLGTLAAAAVMVAAHFGEAPFSPVAVTVVAVLMAFSVNVLKPAETAAKRAKKGE